MKLFTGCLAAGLVASCGRRAGARRAGRYTAASRLTTRRMRMSHGPYAAMPPEAPGRAMATARRAAAGDGGLYRAARKRLFAARHPAAARLRLHDRGDRPRRRGRPAGDRRAQRPDHPLPAGLPDGRQFRRRPERRPMGRSGALPPPTDVRPAPRRGRRPRCRMSPAARVPVPKAEPAAPGRAEAGRGRPRRRSKRPSRRVAAAHEAGRGTGDRAGRRAHRRTGAVRRKPRPRSHSADRRKCRRRRGLAAEASCARVAHPRLRTTTKKRPGFPGRFRVQPISAEDLAA